VLRSVNPVLAALLTTSTVVTVALAWFGLRNLEQERAMARQAARERMETGADAIAAGIRGRLAEAGESLSGWFSNRGSSAHALDGAVFVAVSEGQVEVVPHGGLPFVPWVASIQAPERVFAEAEAIEFAGDRLPQAEEMYRKLSRHSDPRIRAEALLRLGRVQRKSHHLEAAMESYRSLTQLGEVSAGGLPAELAGLDGQRLIRAAANDHAGEQEIAERIARLVDSGRWLLPRGEAEFYRELAERVPKPESWLLAEALARLWEAEGKGSHSTGSLRVIEVEGRAVVTLWRSSGQRSTAMACFADRFVARIVPAGYGYQMADAAGHRVAGAASIPSETVARVLGDPQNPWMLRVWSNDKAGSEGIRPGPRLLLAMLAIAILFLWGTVYFMARAIRREAKVAQLQSDFVAAVSHEFRSPLTTVRQLSEMLEMDQVPSDERRRKYYRVLSGEARRLQRLVETLLNFGKMEAGAEQYHFEQLEVRELLSRAVREATAQEDETSSRVRVSGPDAGIYLLGDADALALALRNLVDNALKYSPASEKVDVKWDHGAGRVSISVVDYGPGIPREEREAIFQKFVRGRSAIEASIKGTGVGLAMVRYILSAHSGEVKLESEPGHGSTFTLVLTEAK
jgi:two-component sensor histidine kinase